jgi:hypothetical protein
MRDYSTLHLDTNSSKGTEVFLLVYISRPQQCLHAPCQIQWHFNILFLMTILLNIFIIAACFNIWNTMAMNPYTMQSNFEQT